MAEPQRTNPAMPTVLAWLDLVELRSMLDRPIQCESVAPSHPPECTHAVTHRIVGRFCGIQSNVCQARVASAKRRMAEGIECLHCWNQGRRTRQSECWTIIPI